jgi:uncharacterized membrane protein
MDDDHAVGSAPDAEGQGSEETERETLRRRFRRMMVTGIVVLVPAVVTFVVLQMVFQWLDGIAQPLIKRVFQRQTDIPGLGLGLTIFVVWLTGVLASNVFGRRLISQGDDFVTRLPVIGNIYAPVKQFIETVVHADERQSFRRVVLAQYPADGRWILGFGTGELKVDESGRQGRCVFVPTSPNPATGWMVIMPPDKVCDTDLTVEDAMRLICSGGIVVPDSLRDLTRFGLDPKATVGAPGPAGHHGSDPPEPPSAGGPPAAPGPEAGPSGPPGS